MPRIPKATELSAVRLDPARNPAQIDERVASSIGAAGKAWGHALEAVGGAFGEVTGKFQAADDAALVSKAKLEWMDFTQRSMEKIRPECGRRWLEAGRQREPTFKAGYADFKGRYVDQDR